MKYAFFGQEDYIVGLANSTKSSPVIENTFEFFDKNKVDLVIASDSGFTRELWKNVVKNKPAFALISNNPSAGKIEQLKLKNVKVATFSIPEIVAYDPIRYNAVLNSKVTLPDCFICDSPNIMEYYYRYAPSGTLIYSKQLIYHPQYRGWLNDYQLQQVIFSSNKIYDYCESNEYTHLSYTIVGCLGNIVTNKNKPLFKKLKIYKDSLREINEKISILG